METLRLRKLQQPPHAERLFGALVVRSGLVPQGAYQIRDPTSVPKALRRIAKLAAANGCTWSCWAHGSRTWLLTGELLLPLSRKRGAPPRFDLASRIPEVTLPDAAAIVLRASRPT